MPTHSSSHKGMVLKMLSQKKKVQNVLDHKKKTRSLMQVTETCSSRLQAQTEGKERYFTYKIFFTHLEEKSSNWSRNKKVTYKLVLPFFQAWQDICSRILGKVLCFFRSVKLSIVGCVLHQRCAGVSHILLLAGTYCARCRHKERFWRWPERWGRFLGKCFQLSCITESSGQQLNFNSQVGGKTLFSVRMSVQYSWIHQFIHTCSDLCLAIYQEFNNLTRAFYKFLKELFCVCFRCHVIHL